MQANYRQVSTANSKHLSGYGGRRKEIERERDKEKEGEEYDSKSIRGKNDHFPTFAVTSVFINTQQRTTYMITTLVLLFIRRRMI
jgi:hypothetical protein